MKYRFVSFNGKEWFQIEFENEIDLIGAMAERGYTWKGRHTSPSTRRELQHEPTFDGLFGPMFDGDAIRYENPRANEALSV